MKIPAHLDRIGKATYQQVWTTLEALGKLNDIDAKTVEIYADLWSDYCRARSELAQAELMTVASGNRYATVHPAFTMKASCIDKIGRIQRDWGVSNLLDRPDTSSNEGEWSDLKI